MHRSFASLLSAPAAVHALLPAGAVLALVRSDRAGLEADAAQAGIEAYAARLHPRRRADFLAGRLAAQAALRQLGASDTHVGHTGAAPRWPAGTCGAISHSAGRAVALAASTRSAAALGIDIEPRIGPQRLRAVRHVLGPEEIAECERNADPWAWTRAWAAKEAAFKCAAALGGDPPLASLRLRWHDAERGVAVAGAAPRIALASVVADELMWVIASVAPGG